MGTVSCVIAVKLPASLKPEWKPFTVGSTWFAGIHGEANKAWIAVWFPWVTNTECKGQPVGTERTRRTYS